jgi:hypothetical protein
MSAPNLNITVEPLESGKVVYSPLAPKTSNDQPQGQLSLKLSIKNNEGQQVHVNQLKISFIGPPSVSAVTIPLNLNIGSNATETWFFATENNIILPVPAPGQIKLSISCNNFTNSKDVTLPLAGHKSPTAEQSYGFPARASNLRLGEYWSGVSAKHGAAGDGSQLFAYDMGVVAFQNGQWTGLLPGKDGTKNTHYRIWGKPIYAAANGTVVAFRNDIPTNPTPGEDLSPPHPVEGNHFYIQSGDELLLYAHFQPGSLNSNLLTVGANVHKGDFLGLAGNSGNSSGPHLHLHVIQATQPWGGPPRPLPFHDIHVVDITKVHPPDPAGPWVTANDQALPSVSSIIWPSPSTPSWYPPGWAELARHGVPESSYQQEFDRIVSSGYRLVWIDGYDVNGKTFFNVIFRPADGTQWVARHGLDSAGYQSEFDNWVGKGFRLKHVESYLSGGKIRYAPIFTKRSNPPFLQEPAFTAYHGRSANEHQALFDDLTAKGWRPVNITAVSPGGNRNYAALYEKRDVGSFFVKSFLTPAEYQTQFDQNVSAGRKLVYLNSYSHEGDPRIIAIWQQQASANFVARHGLTSSQYQAEFDQRLSEGYLTRAVTGYEQSGSARFAAFWSK